MTEPSIVTTTIATVKNDNNIVFHLIDTQDEDFFVDKRLVEFGRGLILNNIDGLKGDEKNKLKDILQDSLTKGFILDMLVCNDKSYMVLSFSLNNVLFEAISSKISQTAFFIIKAIDPDRSCISFFIPSSGLEDKITERIKNNVLDYSKFTLLDLVRLIGLKNITILISIILILGNNPVTNSVAFNKLIDTVDNIIEEIYDR